MRESLSDLDPSIKARLEYFSENLDIPLITVIQNIIISDWARKAARVKIEGPQPGRYLPEFVKEVLPDGMKRVLTGERLFDSLFEIYCHDFRVKQS